MCLLCEGFMCTSPTSDKLRHFPETPFTERNPRLPCCIGLLFPRNLALGLEPANTARGCKPTGHQDLGAAPVVEWISQKLKEVVRTYKVQFGETSLAIGADQLFTKILRDRGIPYRVIVPSKGYEATFHNSASLQEYRDLLNSAADVITRPFGQPTEEAFFEAGKEIVDTSTMLVAV
jgi:hypothetical protein